MPRRKKGSGAKPAFPSMRRVKLFEAREWRPRGHFLPVVEQFVVHGRAMTVQEVAALAGVTRNNAYLLLCQLSMRIPIFDDPETGQWQYLQ